MKQVNYYAQTIDIITSNTLEYKKIVQEIAKTSPSVFVKAFQKVYPNIERDDLEYIELLKQGLKIQAIKLRREKTGEGLREAKSYIDQLQYRLGY